MEKTPKYHAFTTQYAGVFRELPIEIGIRKHIKEEEETQEIRDPIFTPVTAIVDTGATGSVVTASLAEKLGLIPISMTQVIGVNGVKPCNVYLVDLFLPNHVAFRALEVTEGNLSGKYRALIGMDILSGGDLALTSHDGKLKLSFAYPSTKDIDFVREYNTEIERAKRSDETRKKYVQKKRSNKKKRRK
jgi:predicted aspartyl protease